MEKAKVFERFWSDGQMTACSFN